MQSNVNYQQLRAVADDSVYLGDPKISDTSVLCKSHAWEPRRVPFPVPAVALPLVGTNWLIRLYDQTTAAGIPTGALLIWLDVKTHTINSI